MADDRRQGLRRLEDVRELIRFCRGYGQSIPSRVVARLGELGISDAATRPIDEVLADLHALERAAEAGLLEERRRRDRRWINPSLLEEPEEG